MYKIKKNIPENILKNILNDVTLYIATSF